MTTHEELQAKWPEGTLYARRDIRGLKRIELKFTDMVYVIPRKARTELEIVQAAQMREIDMRDGTKAKPLTIAWFLDNPQDLGVEMTEQV